MATSAEHAAHKMVIRYCVDRGMTPIETKREMERTKVFGNVSRTLVYRWHERFTNGWTDIGENRGRPNKKNDCMIKLVKNVTDMDRRQTVREIADRAGISKSAVQRTLSDELSMSRVCARWVPRLLTDEEIKQRVVASTNVLNRNRRDRNFLSKIVTMDETWLHYFEPEGKRQSSIWKTPNTPQSKKARHSKSLCKVMFMVFVDCRGVILAHAVPQGHTVNAAYYSKVVRRDLLYAIRKERPGMADNLENIIYHHDNAPAHSTSDTELELATLGFQRLPHPPYSPDLPPLDFAYFPALKAHLRGTRFDGVDDIRRKVTGFNHSAGNNGFRMCLIDG